MIPYLLTLSLFSLLHFLLAPAPFSSCTLCPPPLFSPVLPLPPFPLTFCRKRSKTKYKRKWNCLPVGDIRRIAKSFVTIVWRKFNEARTAKRNCVEVGNWIIHCISKQQNESYIQFHFVNRATDFKSKYKSIFDQVRNQRRDTIKHFNPR